MEDPPIEEILESRSFQEVFHHSPSFFPKVGDLAIGLEGLSPPPRVRHRHD